MSSEVTLPALGESVTEGTVSRWLKAVGDTVEVDEPLLEVSTDKVDTEIPSPIAGTLLEVRFNEDDVAQVGDVLAIIGDGDDAAAEDAPAEEPAEEAAEEPAEEETPTEDEAPAEEPAAEEAPAAEEKSDSQGSASAGDATEVTLPALGESVTEGTVSRWLKAVGDTVEMDEPLLEVSTDKVDTEIPSPAAGTLLEVRFNEDDVAQVGEVLALIGSADSASSEPPAEPPAEEKQEAPAEDEKAEEPEPAPKEEAPKQEEPKQSAPQQQAAPQHSEKVEAAVARRAAEASPDNTYVTPLVRKLAAEHNVDLATLEGTGVGGRIRKQDVLAAAEEAKKAPAEEPKAAPKAEEQAEEKSAPLADESSKVRGKTEKLSRMRKVIAQRMKESLDTSAQLTATVEVDLTAIAHIRSQVKDDFKAREGASLSFLPFITKATVEALKAYPKLNATMDQEAGTVTYADGEHIGIAVDTERGLMVPVLKDAGDLNLTGLAKKIGDVAGRTRKGQVSPDELSGGTFTITNYGSAGTLFDTPIINQPEVAILGTGALVKRPVVITDKFGGETIAVRQMMYLSLSYDHRLIDGADAARFLVAIKDRLEDGDFGGELGL